VHILSKGDFLSLSQNFNSFDGVLHGMWGITQRELKEISSWELSFLGSFLQALENFRISYTIN
jgi:hypothetical protein